MQATEGALWLVFHPDGRPYFNTVYPLDQEQHRWIHSGFIVKEVKFTLIDGDIKLEIPDDRKDPTSQEAPLSG